eukprot:4891436-Pyramimonas_sp.AAC.1
MFALASVHLVESQQYILVYWTALAFENKPLPYDANAHCIRSAFQLFTLQYVLTPYIVGAALHQGCRVRDLSCCPLVSVIEGGSPGRRRPYRDAVGGSPPIR